MHRTQPLMNLHPAIQAVIFDMDGLMFDTERIAQKAWQQAAIEFGYVFPEAMYRGVIGLKLPDVREFIYQQFGADFPFDQAYYRKQQLLDSYITNQGISLKPGLTELLARIEDLAILKAVASSSGKQIILKNLSAAGIRADRFHAIVGGDEVQDGKPSPDIFLEVARRLGTDRSECLVLEDSNAGILAAHTAGMLAVMVPDLIPPEAEARKLAYRILPDLQAVNREIFTKNGG